MQPSDSLSFFGSGSGLPSPAPTFGRVLVPLPSPSLSSNPSARRKLELPTRMAHRLPVWPESPKESPGSPGLLDRPLRARRCQVTPSGASPASPLAPSTLLPSSNQLLWAPDTMVFRGCTPRLTRLRTYASVPALLPRLQGSLPTCRARLWSDGDCTRWTTPLNFR